MAGFSKTMTGSLHWRFQGTFLNEAAGPDVTGQNSATDKGLIFTFEINRVSENTSKKSHQSIKVGIKNLRTENSELIHVN